MTFEWKESVGRRPRVVVLVVAAVSLLVAASSAQASSPELARYAHALQPEAMDSLLDALAPLEPGDVVEGGWRLDGLQVRRFDARFTLVGPGGGTAVVTLVASDVGASSAGERLDGQTFSLLLGPGGAGGTAAARALASRLIAAERAGALGGLWTRARVASSGAPGAAGAEPSAGDDSPEAGGVAAQPEGDDGFAPAAAFVSLSERQRVTLCWLLWAALAVLLCWHALCCWRAARERLVDSLALFALFVGALVLRAALATWGPGDHAVNTASVFLPPGADPFYGTAPNALAKAVFLVAPTNGDTLVLINLFIGAMAAPVVVFLARALGLGPTGDAAPVLAAGCQGRGATASRASVPLGAWYAGIFVAIQPLFVRHAGESNRQVFVVLLAAIASWALARAMRGGPWRLLPVAGIAAWLAMESRPEAVVLGPVLALLPLFLAPGWGAFRLWPPGVGWRALAAVGLGGAAWLSTAPTVGALSTRAGGGLAALTPFDPELNPWLDPDFVASAAIGLAVLGAIVAVARRSRGALWVLAALLVSAWATSSAPTLGPHLANARYHTLSLLFPCLLGAYALSEVVEWVARRGLRRVAWAVGAAGLVGVVATTVGPLVALVQPRTIDLEYRFLVEAMERLPDDAIVRSVYSHVDNRGLKNLFWFPPTVEKGLSWGEWTDAPDEREARPTFYYHAAFCQNPLLEGGRQARCARALAAYGDRPVVEAHLPARPFGYDRYLGDSVPVGFYVVSDGEPGGGP